MVNSDGMLVDVEPCPDIGMGFCFRTTPRSQGKNAESGDGEGAAVEGQKSPGTERGVPWTSSAEKQLRSSLEAVRMLSNTQGHSATQSGPDKRAISALFWCL